MNVRKNLILFPSKIRSQSDHTWFEAVNRVEGAQKEMIISDKFTNSSISSCQAIYNGPVVKEQYEASLMKQCHRNPFCDELT